MKSRFSAIILLVIAFLCVVAMGIPVQAKSIPEVESSTLIEEAKYYNNQEILLAGEVIGDVMARPGGYWMNVLNNGTAVGVWMTSEQRFLIHITGGYGSKGDYVSIVGTFNQACSDHGGDFDIHAHTVNVIKPGKILPVKINTTRMIIAILLFFPAMISVSFLISRKYWIKRKRIR